MDFMEKAKIQMEHWVRHNEDHLEEYEGLADNLAATGQGQAAAHVREMAALVGQGNERLRQALQVLSQN